MVCGEQSGGEKGDGDLMELRGDSRTAKPGVAAPGCDIAHGVED